MFVEQTNYSLVLQRGQYLSHLNNFIGVELASLYAVGPINSEQERGGSFRNLLFLNLGIKIIRDLLNNATLDGVKIKSNQIMYIVPYRGNLLIIN